MKNYRSKSLSGMAFLTKDQYGYCAKRLIFGWWYKNCSQCNVLGQYGRCKEGQRYMMWEPWRNRIGLAKITMLLKPYSTEFIYLLSLFCSFMTVLIMLFMVNYYKTTNTHILK